MRPAIVLLYLAAACASATDPSTDVHLVVRGAPFTSGADHLAPIPYTIVNDGETPVYVAACDSKPRPGVVVNGDGGSAGICTANVSMVPVAIPAHGRLADTAVAWKPGPTRLEVDLLARDASYSTTLRSAAFEVR